MSKVKPNVNHFFQKKKLFAKQEIALFNQSETLFEEEDPLGVIFEPVDEDLSDFERKISSIKLLTSQIRAIQKQEILFVGERIYKVRELIKQMKNPDRTFSAWINHVFPNKASAYNALAYFEFHSKLPSLEDKATFQSIPYKAAYILAARKADITTKIEVVNSIKGMSNDQAIQVLNLKLPSSRKNNTLYQKQENSLDLHIYELLIGVFSLIKKSKKLSQQNKKLLKTIVLYTQNM